MFSFDSISTVLVDIDNTLTQTDGQEALDTPLEEYLSSLAGKVIDLPQEFICTTESVQALGIDPEKLFFSLRADFARHTIVPEDAIFFLQKMRELQKPVYTATTNCRFFCNLKLSLGCPATTSDHCEFIAGYFPGNAFGDPRGKFAPDYFPKILQAGAFDPNHTLMVGDDMRRDIQPAQQAGIKYLVQIDRHSTLPLDKHEGFIKVNSLRNLFPIK